MKIRCTWGVVAVLAAAVVLPVVADAAGKRSRVRDRASAELAGASGAEGSVDVRTVRRKRGTLRRGVVRVRAQGLDPRAEYALLLDDPNDPRGAAMVRVADVRSNKKGRLRIRLGKRRGNLPFEADPAALAGARVELRDATGAVVLTGSMPPLEHPPAAAVHGDGEAHGCPFEDVVVVEHDFVADTVGAEPAGWTVTDTDALAGRTVLVDDTVDDGGGGQSVRITDTDPTTSAGPAMTRAFTGQTGRMALAFTLIPADTESRVVARLGSLSGTTFTPVGGHVPGVGIHDDGQVGLGGAADFGAYAVGTPVRFRIDVDVASDTYGLTIDGVVVASGLTLGLAPAGLTGIDAVRFTTGDDATGTANVDAVRALEVVEDCPPVVAGPPFVIEVRGNANVVVLGTVGPASEPVAVLDNDRTEHVSVPDDRPVHVVFYGNANVLEVPARLARRTTVRHKGNANRVRYVD